MRHIRNFNILSPCCIPNSQMLSLIVLWIGLRSFVEIYSQKKKVSLKWNVNLCSSVLKHCPINEHCHWQQFCKSLITDKVSLSLNNGRWSLNWKLPCILSLKWELIYYISIIWYHNSLNETTLIIMKYYYILWNTFTWFLMG